MAADRVHLVFILLSLPPTLLSTENIQVRSDTSHPDHDFDLVEGLLESQHVDDTKKFLEDSLLQLQPDQLDFDPGPFQLLPAKV